MIRNDIIRLHHMLDAAQEAVDLFRGRTREDLDGDRMLNLSLVRLLEIIGEAAKGVSPAFRDAHPDIPWKKMVGMRDRLIHGYFDVNLDIVKETVIEDLPPLVAQLEKIIAIGNR
ncbi:MAG: DUF86 domain-containing protein [bacterium]